MRTNQFEPVVLGDSRATVISLMPWPVDEQKPGVYPGTFHIDAARPKKFEILVVGESKYRVYIDSDRGHMEMVHPANHMAKSIVDDYKRATASNVTVGEPGIFWVPGEHNKAMIKSLFKDQLDAARAKMEQWFGKLVELADDDWSRNRRRETIPDIARHAAAYLGLDRAWAKDVVLDLKKTCPFCSTAVLDTAVICPSCKEVIDRPRYEALKAGGVMHETMQLVDEANAE